MARLLETLAVTARDWFVRRDGLVLDQQAAYQADHAVLVSSQA